MALLILDLDVCFISLISVPAVYFILPPFHNTILVFGAVMFHSRMSHKL
jgi:hypothetical protein